MLRSSFAMSVLAALVAASALVVVQSRSQERQFLGPRGTKASKPAIYAGEGAEPDVDAAIRYQMELRSYPDDAIDIAAYWEAWKYRDTFPYQTGGDHEPAAPKWTCIGPYNNPGPTGLFNGPGPLSGRVNSIAIVNGKKNSPVYVATPDGGIFEGSYDGSALFDKKQWRPICDVDAWPSLQTSSVAVNPDDPSEILAGTGDFVTASQLGCNGILEGTLNQQTGNWDWTPTLGIFSSRAVSKILYVPEDSEKVYATTGRGASPAKGEMLGSVYKATPIIFGVKVFSRISDLDARNLNWTNIVLCANPVAAVADRWIYACGYRPFASGKAGTVEVWRSTVDPDSDWKEKDTGIQAESRPTSIDIATSPTDPDTAYVSVGARKLDTNNKPTISTVKIYRTSNGGDKWTLLVSASSAGTGFPAASDKYNLSQEYYDYYIACGTRKQAKLDVDVVFSGLITISASPDGGKKWADIGFTYNANGGAYLTHNDQHCMAFRPGDYSQGLCGNDGGIYKFTYDSTARPPATFDPGLNRDLVNAQYYHADWDVANSKPDNILAGSQDNGTARTRNNASPPIWEQSLAFGDGSGSAISRSDANYRYAGGYQRVTRDNFGRPIDVMSFKATNNGTWTLGPADDRPLVFPPTEPAAFFPPILADDRIAQAVFAGSNHLYFFDYRLVIPRWVPFGTEVLAGQGKYLTVIAKDPSGASTILTGSIDGLLFRSTKGGVDGSWSRISSSSTAPLPKLPISGISVNPDDGKQVFVTLMGGKGDPSRIWACDDVTLAFNKRKWRPLLGAGLPPNLPLACLALDPAKPSQIIYVGSDIGLFYTNNGGTAWKNGSLPLGLPNLRVSELRIIGAGDEKTLNLASYGRGIWRTPLPLP